MNASLGPFARPNPDVEPVPQVYFQVIREEGDLLSDANSVTKLADADIVMIFAAGNKFKEQPNASMEPNNSALVPLIMPATHGKVIHLRTQLHLLMRFIVF
tara:strand:- start:376 stop:678 length:303 start_codon:yes stop_codon:yes gene_type:complete